MTGLPLELDAELLASVDRHAAWRGLTRDEWITAAIQYVAWQEAAFEAKVQEGIDDADAGRLISQEDMEAWFETRHHQAAAE